MSFKLVLFTVMAGILVYEGLIEKEYIINFQLCRQFSILGEKKPNKKYMKKVSGIFQLLVALFFGVALVFFLMFDSVRNGFGIQELTAGTVVLWLLVGLVLFLISWATTMIYTNNLNSRIKKLELEKNEVKAVLYDMERGVKVGNIDKKIDTIEEDKDGSGIRPRENFQ